ncbi:MAG: dihydropteroate synthase, partial [Actinomycetota bacterium]
DSFSDGGRFTTGHAALARIRQVGREGAAICDVGAESTRPGADPVPVEEELRRLDPLLRLLAAHAPAIPISIDTSKARVAEAALDAGAVLVNDVTAGGGDPRMLPLVADRDAAVCLMHMRGEPRTMQEDPRYRDVVREVGDHLEARLAAAVAAGVAEERVLLDPGIGFGKTLAHNLALLAGLPALARRLGRPLVVGVSRKGMIGALTGRETRDRLAGSLGGALAAVAGGAAVVRAHDVAETVDALRVWEAVEAART